MRAEPDRRDERCEEEKWLEAGILRADRGWIAGDDDRDAEAVAFVVRGGARRRLVAVPRGRGTATVFFDGVSIPSNAGL